MHISPFFRDLRSSYQSEIDDMTFDSEGQHVLRQRLGQRRKEMDFLVNMMELSPEMVAVVFHEGFRFTSPAVMDRLIAQEGDDLPEWDQLRDTIELAPWAHDLEKVALKQPMGEWFLTLSAGLEYMFHKHDASAQPPVEAEEDDDEDELENGGEPTQLSNSDDAPDLRSARQREEAGADWMAEQGFDRKD
jgi:hypothetical protein